MGKIGYGFGSEWHLLRYLGYHRQWFSDFVAQQIGSHSVGWLDFGFTGVNEPIRQDAEYQGIDFLTDPLIKTHWKSFWPTRAQHWDAVGVAKFENQDEWILVEAKAHAEELGKNEPCRAISAVSKAKIRSALLSTQQALGIHDIPVDCWLEHYYQTCNRYAALHFLRNICVPAVPARLLFVYFYGETRPEWNCPASPEKWQEYLTSIDRIIGIQYPSPLSSFVHRVFVPVHPLVK